MCGTNGYLSMNTVCKNPSLPKYKFITPNALRMPKMTIVAMDTYTIGVKNRYTTAISNITSVDG